MPRLEIPQELDVLLVQPSGTSYNIGNTASDGYAMSLVSAMCAESGLKADYVILRSDDFPDEPIAKLAELIVDAKPKIVGVEAMSCYSNAAIELASRIKSVRDQIKIVLGSYHASGYPEVLYDAKGAIDYLCLGAGEKTFPNLAIDIIQGGPVLDDRLRMELPLGRFDSRMTPDEQRHYDSIVEQAAYATFDDGKVNLIPRIQEDLFRNIHQIVIPERNLKAHDAVTSGLLCLPLPSKQIAATLHTTKGCSDNCSYCQSANVFGVGSTKLFQEKGINARTRSPENVVKELAYLSAQGINFVFLTDLIFNASGDFVRELAARVIAAKKKGEVAPEMGFYCMCKAHSISTQERFGLDLNIYRDMKNMGVSNIAFGVEFSNDKARRKFGRRDARDQDLLNHLNATNEAGIFSKGLMMYGSQDETVETLEGYAEYMLSLPIDVWRLAPIVPFVGTRYGNRQIRELVARGQLELPKDFDLFNADTAIILPDDQRLTREVLARKKREILRQVYSDPRLYHRLNAKAQQHPELQEAVDYFYRALQKIGYMELE